MFCTRLASSDRLDGQVGVLGGLRGDEHGLDLGVGEELLGEGICPAGTRQDGVEAVR